MEKLDLAKRYKTYYSATTQPALVEIEATRYLSLAGKGDPSQPEYALTLQALYSTAYGIKFWYKAQKLDFVVAKLEGLWWFDDTQFKGIKIAEAPRQIPRSEWHYRMLIRLPEYVSEEVVKNISEKTASEKQINLARQIELYQLQEGKCVQILHVGAFEKEPESLQQIEQFCKERQLLKNGLHHEIYLSDFNKTAPEKLRTILREPVK